MSTYLWNSDRLSQQFLTLTLTLSLKGEGIYRSNPNSLSLS